MLKKFLLIVLFSGLNAIVFAQQSYIQVSGEPDLSVFLDGLFKGTTTVEYGGYIIENVSAGKHTIKIVKKGYTPYEESISVKAGEVLAYKVKPFVKHTVTISEQGNTAVTEKKAEIKTGKLIIQSVPIEIKISIPKIEGVENAAKTKDEWIANEIPVGEYDIEFSFGNKTVNKRIQITEGDVTSAFVNMMSGDFTIKSSLTEKIARQKNATYFNSLINKYKIKRRMSFASLFNSNPDASILSAYKINNLGYTVPDKAILKNPNLTPGARGAYGSVSDGNLLSYVYAIASYTNYQAAIAALNAVYTDFGKQVETNYLYRFRKDANEFTAECKVNEHVVTVNYLIVNVGKEHYELRVDFLLH